MSFITSRNDDGYCWKVAYVVSFCFGISQAVWLYGELLNPMNVTWLLAESDSFQHFIGWDMFRRDEWRWPLGALPTLGYTMEGSIVFSDSIPLLAILLKAFHSTLPDPFQYVGLTMLCNLSLSGIASVWLVRRIGGGAVVACLFSLLVLGGTTITFRGPTSLGHEALSAHWLILFCIGLAMHKSLCGRFKSWAFLLILAVVIHFYIFFMLGVMWGVCAFYTIWENRADRKAISAIILKMSLTILLVSLVMWAAGYFEFGVEVEGSAGFGIYSASFLSFFNPGNAELFLKGPLFSGTSYFFQGWSSPVSGQYEGYSYVGIGMLLLWFLAFFLFVFGLTKRGASQSEQKSMVGLPLWVSGLFLFLFSLSDRWVLGGWFWEFKYPGILSTLTQHLRSSGRMIWPLMYILAIASFCYLLRRITRRNFVILLSLFVLLQWWDSYPWFKYVRGNADALVKMHGDLPSSFTWLEDDSIYSMTIGKKYLQYLPGDDMYNLKAASWLAARHDQKLNVAYYARVNPGILHENAKAETDRLKEGYTSKSTLYMLTNENLWSEVCEYKALKCVYVNEDVVLATTKVRDNG